MVQVGGLNGPSGQAVSSKSVDKERSKRNAQPLAVFGALWMADRVKMKSKDKVLKWRLMLVLNLPFKALRFLTLMRPSLVLFLVLWLKLVKVFLKVRCRLALLPFLISCLIWLDLVASLPLIKERILVIILLLHFLSLMLGSVLVLMLPLLVWLTPDLRIKKSLLKCNWTIRKRLPRCKMRLKKRLLAFSRRLHARI